MRHRPPSDLLREVTQDVVVSLLLASRRGGGFDSSVIQGPGGGGLEGEVLEGEVLFVHVFRGSWVGFRGGGVRCCLCMYLFAVLEVLYVVM